MKKSNHIAIIGGGVIGLACAHYLVEEGMKVTILDRDKVGSGASHGNCGLLYFSDVIPLCVPGAVRNELVRTLCGTSPLYIKPELNLKRVIWLCKFAAHCRHSHKVQAAKDKFTLLKYSAGLFKKLFDEVDLDCDKSFEGLLSVFRSRKNWKGYSQASHFIENFCPGYKPLDTVQALALEPALRDDIAGVWHNTTDGHLRPDALMTAWKDHLGTCGVKFMEFCEVQEFCSTGRTVKSIETSKGSIGADAFILATGAWIPQLGKSLGLDIPVQPGKGYSITMERPENCPALPCMLYERNMVVTPWKSGYRLGGTMEFSGYDMTQTRNRLEKLINGAAEYLKDPVGNPVVEEWTSLRPMTYDDIPILDRSPRQDNLVLATGHGMLGLTMATGTGRIAADLILEKKPEINTRPFAITRF